MNINSLWNKNVDLSEILSNICLDYLVVSKTKLDSSFFSALFHITHNGLAAQRVEDKNEGKLIDLQGKVLYPNE